MDSSRKPCASVGISGKPQEINKLKDYYFVLDKPNDGAYLVPVSNPLSEAARILGQSRSEKKAKASRENGKLGGRPSPKSKRKKGKRAA